MLDPHLDDNWDVIVVTDLNGQLHRSPGTVVLSGHARKVGWDVKEASAQDGGSTERKGQPIQRFKATFELVDDPAKGSDFALWDEFEEVLRSSYEADPPIALSVSHRDLARNGYFAASIEEIGEIVKDETGLGTIVVGFLEYRPPKPRGGAGGARPDQDRQDPDAETEADKRIKERLKKIQDLEDEWEEL